MKSTIQNSSVNDLPRELRSLVNWATEVLGESIQEFWGEKSFRRIEVVRKEMAALRGMTGPTVEKHLERELKRLRAWPKSDLEELARSFSIMLELINCCEAAYRNFRLKQKRVTPSKPGQSKFPIRLVMTSHPTEARRPEAVFLLQTIQSLLEGVLHSETPSNVHVEQLKNLLTILLKISLFKNRKPQVADEARYLASIILREEILDAILLNFSESFELRLRTWVGGDKDGHPGVDETILVKSLEIFREAFLHYIKRQIGQLAYQMGVARQMDLRRALLRFERRIFSISKIKRGDGAQLKAFWNDFAKLEKAFENGLVGMPVQLQRVRKLREMFPALVVPLELREASEVNEQNLAAKNRNKFALTRMLLTLRNIASGESVLRYVQALVISHVRDAQDVINAFQISRDCLHNTKLPIVPLFEDAAALENCKAILENVFKNKPFRQALRKDWGDRFEVMLGYSDSAKESGLLCSKTLIQRTMFETRDVCLKHGAHPIFFNGSGGSVARGGGSLEEQTAWWCREAFDPYKATIQGEMVQRTFSSSEILGSFLHKLPELNKSHRRNEKFPHAPALWNFAQKTKEVYTQTVADPEFLKLIQSSTVYPFLSLLRMGSRPTKRSKFGGVNSLRAIPWVLTWTQARLLFPNWWGLGSAWASMNEKEKRALKATYRNSPLLTAFMKQLGFTLAKVELPVWHLYLRTFASKAGNIWDYEIFAQEFELTVTFFQELTQQKNFLWFRPWLGESIFMRSPMIFPLNLTQMIAMETKNTELLRESVVGIACGMMTTG